MSLPNCILGTFNFDHLGYSIPVNIYNTELLFKGDKEALDKLLNTEVKEIKVFDHISWENKDSKDNTEFYRPAKILRVYQGNKESVSYDNSYDKHIFLDVQFDDRQSNGHFISTHYFTN